MVVQTQSSPSVGQDSAPPTKHKLIGLDADDLKKSLGSLAPIATTVVEKTKVALKKAEEVYEIAKPTLEPMVQLIAQKHQQNPEVVKLVVAFVAIVYGGCFFNLAVLYATWKLAGTQGFVNEVQEAYNGTGSNVVERVLDTLRKSNPENVQKLMKNACFQFAIFSGVLFNGWATAAVLAIFVEEQASYLRPLIITKLKPMASTDEMQRWIPFGVSLACKTLLTLVGLFSPRFLAAFLFSYEGGLVVASYVSQFEKTSEMTVKLISLGLAGVGSLYQAYYGFVAEGIVASVVYTLFFPIYMLEGFFSS